MRLKKPFVFALFTALSLMTACGKKEDNPAAPAAEEKINLILTSGEEGEELFRIGTQHCSRDEALLYLTNMQDRYRRVYGDDIWQRSVDGQSLEDKLRQITLSRLVQVKTMALMAADRGIEADGMTASRVTEATKRFCSGLSGSMASDAAFSEETVRTCYEQMAIADLVYRQIIEETDPEISDDEARMVTVEQILLKTGETDEEGRFTPYDDRQKREVYQKAQSLLERLEGGEDFDQVAAANNEADRITVSFGKGEREEAIDRTAFELGSDQISGVIETQEGYLILKCIQPFDRQQTDLRKEMIAGQRKEEAFLHVYEDFTQGQIRTMNDRAWNNITVPSSEQLTEAENFFVVYREVFEEE